MGTGPSSSSALPDFILCKLRSKNFGERKERRGKAPERGMLLQFKGRRDDTIFFRPRNGGVFELTDLKAFSSGHREEV